MDPTPGPGTLERLALRACGELDGAESAGVPRWAGRASGSAQASSMAGTHPARLEQSTVPGIDVPSPGETAFRFVGTEGIRAAAAPVHVVSLRSTTPRRTLAKQDAESREARGPFVDPLFQDGYTSIGCAPCTRRPEPCDDPRAGFRAGFTKTECGIHT